MRLVPTAAIGSGLISFLFQQAVRIKGLYLSSLVSWSGVYALPLLIGSMTATLIDEVSGKPVDSHAWWLLIAIVGFMVIRAVLLLSALQLTFELIFKTSAWIKIDILDRLLARPNEQIIRTSSGEILNRLRDDTHELGGLLEWTTDLIYRSILSIFSVTVLATTDLAMAIPLLLLLSGLLVSIVLKNKVAALQFETRSQQGRIGALITDTLVGIRDLRLAGTVENYMNRLEQKFTERRGVLLRQQLFADLLSDLFRNLVLLGTSIILLTMSLRVKSSGFEVGKLILFLTYSSWLGQQMYFFGKILARYQNGKVAFNRLNQLYVDEQEQFPPAPEVTEPLHELVVEGLTYNALPGISAPVPITFKVRPGELVAITGEIGAGKSRLLHSLLGLNSGVVGKVFWNGIDVTGNHQWMRSPRVAYASQSPHFLQGSLGENIKLGYSQLSSVDIETVMRYVQLEPGSAELLQGADTQLDSGGADRLSGGQRQRLALARMLVRPAELFLVDDCDSSLDPSTARRIWETIRAKSNAAWIVVSQNPVLIELSDQVITIVRTEKNVGGVQ